MEGAVTGAAEVADTLNRFWDCSGGVLAPTTLVTVLDMAEESEVT